MTQWTDFQRQLRHFSSADQEKIRRAFLLGERLHEGQKRRSGEPYFVHPIAVATMLATLGADTDTLIAALLHDAVEDTPITLEEINKEFNGEVAALIEGVTKLSAAEFSEQPTLNEQVETLRKIFTLMQKDIRVMAIKLVDRLHNVRTISFLPPERQEALARETMDVYVKIASRLCMQDIGEELEGRCLAILDPVLSEQLLRLREEGRTHGETVVPAMASTLRAAHPELAGQLELFFEPKTWQKLRLELNADGAVATGMPALNVVLLSPDRDTCYRILGALHDSWQREALSFQDFINTPAENGYRGIHTTIILADGTRVRCKIRTRDMEEYNHRGVTTVCFRPHSAESLATLLPWTKRITPVTEDTKDRSSDFWTGLQNDILGETITVHGPDDQAIQLPSGSTALDGAFHLFRENSLALDAVKVNGKSVPFNTVLQHAVTIDATFAHKQTATREWLPWAQTRYALSLIRSVLAERSEEERALLGREMLQKLFLQRKKGYIQEFSKKNIEEKMRLLGYTSLRDTFIALADGRVTPQAVFETIFVSTSAAPQGNSYVIRYAQGSQNMELLNRIFNVHRKYAGQFRDVRYVQEGPGQPTRTTITATLTPDQLRSVESDLSAAGAGEISIAPRTSTFQAFTTLLLVLLLWGLDPVFARLLIHYDALTPIDFTILRFWSLAILFLIVTTLSRRRSLLEPLKWHNPLLWFSALLLTLVSLTTYAALQAGTATHYEILMTASGLLLATMFHNLPWKKSLALWGLFGITVFFLFYSASWNMESGFLMLLSLVCFAMFLSVSTRYLRQEFIARRRLEYYTAMLVLGSLFILPFFGFASHAIRNPTTMMHVSLFSLVFIGLPYYLFYEVSPRQEADTAIPLSYIMLSVTFFGEILLTRRLDAFTVFAFLGMFLLSFFLERRNSLIASVSSPR
jgi:RelA/SpoT family (p)ppGpp synthetase